MSKPNLLIVEDERLLSEDLKETLLDLLDILTHTLEQIARPAKMPIDGITPFTPMETRVMDLIRQGRTSKEIATFLRITVRGVTFHPENILPARGSTIATSPRCR